MPYTKEEHEKVASKMQRDTKGHFVKKDKVSQPSASKDPISKFLGENAHYSKSQDDILDVHVGNPLHKITKLLEEIKKQKAFSFTLKGSLGIAGVALALGVFGIFGGGKILCDKGIQSQIGVIRILNAYDNNSHGIPVLSQILDFLNPIAPHNRIVLIKNDQTVISLPYSSKADFQRYSNYPVVVTGNYDACSQTLTVNDNKFGVEYFTR